MSTEPDVPAQPAGEPATARPGRRFTVPRGLLAGTLAAAAIVWVPYALLPGSSLFSAEVQTGVNVRVFGADLLAVHVRLSLPEATGFWRTRLRRIPPMRMIAGRGKLGSA